MAVDYANLSQGFRGLSGEMPEVSEWQELLDQIRYFGEGVLYGKNTGCISESASGAILAVVGYYMCCQGELWQMDADDSS